MPVRMTTWDDRGGLYYFDQAAADAAANFFPNYLVLFEGEWVGKPFELMPFAEHIVRQVYGWKRVSDGTRRARLVYIWIPRKNAKSTLAAGVGLLMLLGDAEAGGQVYCLARTEKQARIVFNFATQFVANSRALTSLITPFKTALWCDSLGAKIEPLTGKPAGKHGLNATGIIGDEIHEWSDDELYTYVHQSQGTRRQPLDFLISTAGKRDGVGWEHFKLCEAILNGEIDAPDTFVYIASADPTKDAEDPLYWTTPEAFAEANPGMGISVKPDFFVAEVNRARQNPRLINDIKRYYLNLWVDQATVWLDMLKWDQCGWKDREQPDLDRKSLPMIYRDANLRWKEFAAIHTGRRCYIGVDLSSTTDLTAVVLVFPPDDEFEEWVILPRFYIPRGDMESDIDERTKRDQFDYRAAQAVGAITLTDGAVIDYELIVSDTVALQEHFAVEKVLIDAWNATGVAVQLEQAGLEVEFFRQGFASFSGPTKFLERLVLQKKIDHGGHPVLRWNARNTAVAKDAAENLKPVKDEKTGRIDGIVATIMAIGGSDEVAEGPSVYETRGLLDG